MKYNPILILTGFMMILSSCGGDDPAVNLEPANLSVDLTISDDGSGVVDISAIADNTVEYEINPGDSPDDIVSNTNGVLSHTYERSGQYTIEVKAFGTSGRFVRKSQQINVVVGDPNQPIDGKNGYSTPLEYAGLTLIWQDEFNGSTLKDSNWNFEIGTGNGGWGNNELQYYRQENTSVSDGFMTIEAKRENFSNQLYTSSRITTQNKFDFKYGRVDIRAILPKGQGIWPAFWMLGANFSNVGWPASGEIDIMEMIGGGTGRDDTTHGTIHWDNNGTKADTGGNTQLSSGIFNDEFHVFTIIWDKDEINWFVDDELFFTVDITPEHLSEFQKNFFLIFNLAVGGNWPGSPNGTTEFPQKLIVDYVRVFQ